MIQYMGFILKTSITYTKKELNQLLFCSVSQLNVILLQPARCSDKSE